MRSSGAIRGAGNYWQACSGRIREDVGSVDLPPRHQETKEVIESKLIPCECCGTVVAMLIFAPNATDAGHLEDYARKMYPNNAFAPRGTVASQLLKDRQSHPQMRWRTRAPPATLCSVLE
jgi:hypothetical protein